MRIRFPSVKPSAYIKSLVFLPLILFCIFYSIFSVQALKKTRLLDRIFTDLFLGDTLSEEEKLFILNLPEGRFAGYMKDWSPVRRDAAILLLDLNGVILPVNSGNESTHFRKPVRDPLLTEAESLYGQKLYSSAEESYREYWLLNHYGTDNFIDETILLQIRDAVMKSNESDLWIELLSGWKGFTLSGYEGAFFLATCYEQSGLREEALFWYEQSENRTGDWEQIRRTRWYRLRILCRFYPEDLSLFFETVGPLREDGGYYDDVLDEYFSTLVRQGRWKEFARILPAIEKSGLTGSAAQGYFLLDRGEVEGVVPSGDAVRGIERPRPDPKGYYALRTNPHSWPRLDSHSGLSNMGAFSSEADPPESDCSYKERTEDVYSYLIQAGFISESYRLWKKQKDDLSPETILHICRYLEEEGDLYELIRFAGFWYYQLPFESALELLPWVFPGSSRYAIEDDLIPSELILGIIRRESAFNESISSRVGAGGLMQLMPSTAADLARKNRLDSWDLMNAEDNILLGTLYLEWLQDRPWTGSYVDVLAAYNGGGGNLRSWKRRHGYSDPDLFIQSIPFRETRDYVRKVIVAAASYRYLDTGIPPGDWLDQFYSSF